MDFNFLAQPHRCVDADKAYPLGPAAINASPTNLSACPRRTTMADRDKNVDRTTAPKRLSWMSKYGGSKDKDAQWTLVSPPEGVEVTTYAPAASTHSPSGAGLPYSRPGSGSAVSSSSPPSSSSVDKQRTPSRRSSTSSLTTRQLDMEASKIIMGALERTSSATPADPQPPSRPSLSDISRKSFSSSIKKLSALSLTRGSSDDKERGRSRSQQQQDDKPRSASATSLLLSADDNGGGEASSSFVDRARSMSPFHRRRPRTRDSSPVEPLKQSQSDVESDSEAVIRPRNHAFSQSATSDDDSPDSGEDDDDSEESWSDNDQFDSITEQNTERNAVVQPLSQEPDGIEAPDPLGEGVNIVVPPEPYFPTSLNYSGLRNPRRRKSTRPVSLPLTTSRPVYKQDRCTITLTQGDPARAVETSTLR